MSGGLTVSEIEKWVKLDSSNSITEDAEYLYRIAANIPDKIIELLLSKQSPEQSYFGSTLRISNRGNENFYTLGFYTIQNLDSNQYIIGRTNYGLRNFSIDYQPFLNSSSYISLDLNFDNLDLSGNIFAQAIKADRIYGLTQINQDTNQISSRTVLFLEDKTYEYYAIDDLPTNIFSAIPNNIYNSFSITPSILKLAKRYPFSNLQEKSKGKSKSKKEIKPKINNPHLN